MVYRPLGVRNVSAMKQEVRNLSHVTREMANADAKHMSMVIIATSKFIFYSNTKIIKI